MTPVKSEPFVHLHLHTCFSLLDGACHLKQVMQTALENNMPAVAITDHGVMYGAIDFYKAAQEAGVKPIIGCETYVARGSRHEKSGGAQGAGHHLVLLARDMTGYQNLTRLITASHLEGFYYKPRIDKELLAQHCEGLIGLSACLKGEVAEQLVNDELDAAAATAGEYADILGKENFFLEIMDHGMPEQRKAAGLLAQLSRRSGIPLVATNDVHYLKKDHSRAHEVLLCLQTQTVLSDPNHMRYASDEFYMKTRAEMQKLFGETPDALDRTLEIADRCVLEFELGESLHFPVFETPDGIPQRQYLEQLTLEGITWRYHVKDPLHPADERERRILERMRQEMQVIEQTGFVNYFLVVWDFIHFARGKGVPVGPGRGSGGGSLIAYALGITAIDPLRYNLIFERFLNPERVSPPDFDIDFCQSRRGEVIEYVKEKYGRDSVAQIITFGSLGPKTVIRDVGRVLEIPYGKCDQLSKMVPEDPKMTLKKALEENPEFKNAYQTDEDCKRILDYGFVLEGLYRNPGTHAAGVVIGEKPLIEIIPLARDKDDQPVTQYTMEPLADLGLLKMDFLGLKTLTVIQEALDLIEARHGVEIDMEALPFDDQATFDLLSRGDTVGVFQLESGGMRDLIRRIGIGKIEDLIAMIALYRPGPMNMLPDYVDRKSGKAEIKYDHPDLAPILEETYGVMVYQEQVQQAANVLAGYSLGEADILRRAMGKKKKEEMQKQRAKFIKGCAARKIAKDLAGRIFDTMAEFAGYGFNKAHTAAYSILAYQTAYLKANYPEEFMAALLSSEIGNFDKIPTFIGEAVAMNLKILPPDINQSGVRFTPEPGSIRYGLAGVKNVGAGAARAVVEERERNGPYAGLVDLCSRADPQAVNRKSLESLVRCGALDGLKMHRARLFEGIEFAMSRAAQTLRDRQLGQGSLFDLLQGDGGAEDPVASDDLPECATWSESELLAGERELLGVYMSGHPLTQFEPVLRRYRLAGVTALAGQEDRAMTRIGGIVAQMVKRVTKASKETMAILTVEDLEGSVEALVFPEAFQKYGMHIAQDRAVLVCGEVSKKEDQPKLIAYEVYPLADAPEHFARRISIHVPAAAADGTLDRVRDIVRLHPGRTPVVLCLVFPAGEKVFVETDKAFHVRADEELIHELERVVGEDGVYVDVNPAACLEYRPNRKRWQRNGS